MQFKDDPFLFVCAACEIAGFQLPDAAPEMNDSEARKSDFRLRYEIIDKLMLTIEFRTNNDQVEFRGVFAPALTKADADFAFVALKANYLGCESGLTFAIDPASGELFLYCDFVATDLELADFAGRVADFTTMAMEWRQLMDRPDGDRDILPQHLWMRA